MLDTQTKTLMLKSISKGPRAGYNCMGKAHGGWEPESHGEPCIGFCCPEEKTRRAVAISSKVPKTMLSCQHGEHAHEVAQFDGADTPCLWDGWHNHRPCREASLWSIYMGTGAGELSVAALPGTKHDTGVEWKENVGEGDTAHQDMAHQDRTHQDGDHQNVAQQDMAHQDRAHQDRAHEERAQVLLSSLGEGLQCFPENPTGGTEQATEVCHSRRVAFFSHKIALKKEMRSGFLHG